MDHIVFVSSNYPSKTRPHCGTFVHQLVKAIARKEIKCSVISPISIFDLKHGIIDPNVSIECDDDNNHIKVIRPRYLSFSSINLIAFNTDCLTQMSFLSSVYRSLTFLDTPPSIMYGHFLYPGGASAVSVATKLRIPSIVAVGESSFWSVEPVGFKKAIKDFSDVNGVVAVSSSIKKALSDKLLINENKINVFPNAVDHSLFYPRDKREMRKKFNLPQDRFIISFIGHFDERKGPHRVLSAVSNMDNIGLVFIGNGSIPLISEKILFKGSMDHSMIPEILSASDIFVLPTLNEGSCNSIIEAMACGLPVVTSKGEFNDDIVDDNVAIRVDPENINEIRNAVNRLRINEFLLQSMSSNAIKQAAQFDINLRADRIVSWIKYISGNNNLVRSATGFDKNLHVKHRA